MKKVVEKIKEFWEENALSWISIISALLFCCFVIFLCSICSTGLKATQDNTEAILELRDAIIENNAIMENNKNGFVYEIVYAK